MKLDINQQNRAACAALGLDPSKVGKITIVFGGGEFPTAYIEMAVDTETQANLDGVIRDAKQVAA